MKGESLGKSGQEIRLQSQGADSQHALCFVPWAGHVASGLICHPDNKHLLYPLGCTVVIQDLASKKQTFLHGHTNNVSCVVVSRSGNYVASGQVTFMGFKVDNPQCLTTLH